MDQFVQCPYHETNLGTAQRNLSKPTHTALRGETSMQNSDLNGVDRDSAIGILLGFQSLLILV